MDLPIREVEGEVVERLRHGRNLVVIAPPGAGKTTRIPQVVADRVLGRDGGRVLVLEPRRLAARLAAARIAKERSAKLGGEVGYQVRFDDRTSARTRIAFLTEGVLTRRVQSDPLLEGVGCVVLDEFHERSIHADLALAFLREIQETVRPDLFIVVMSATLDPAPVQRFLGGCPLVVSEGRTFPVDIRYLERPDDRPPVERAVSGARRALRETDAGDVLVFLPGAGEIRRAKEQLERSVEGADVCMLYGDLSAAEQDRAVTPGPRRKLILATNIAESSLTIEGVTTVVDTGLAKILRHDPSRGIDHLERVRISRRSAEQRAGRAGRLAPGTAYRLWTEKEHRILEEDQQAEIHRIDLAPVVLDVIRWAKQDPVCFGWFEAPPESGLRRAVGLLLMLGAVTRDFGLTELGERLAAFPLHPRLAAILVAAHRAGRVEEGAGLAAIASERDMPRTTGVVGGCDLLHRLEEGPSRHVRKVQGRLADVARRVLGEPPPRSAPREEALHRAVLAGFPDRVGKVRGDEVVLVGGGSARLSKESVVRSAELLVAVEIGGGDRRASRWSVVRTATQISEAWLPVEERTEVHWNGERQAAEAVRVRAYHDLVLQERPGRQSDPEALAAVLADAAAKDLERALPMTDELKAFLLRYRFLRENIPDLDAPDLGDDPRADLLEVVTQGKKSFAELQKIDLVEILEARLSHPVRAALSKEAPERLRVPSGREARLRYEAAGPVLSIRLQEVFGLYETPRVAKGRVPVTMELLAPNMRPVQVTRDLASFWATTYAEVRKELRRRYPKHQWPEDPRAGIPSAKTKRQLQRKRGS